MAAAGVMSDCLVDYKVSKSELLRGIISDRLTAAAREIFAVVERTVSGYEEEAAGLRQEIDRQRVQLEAILQPRVSLIRTGEVDLRSQDVPVNTEDHKGEDDDDEEEEEEEFIEEPSSQTNKKDPDYQPAESRSRCHTVKRRGRGRPKGKGLKGLNLRVCLIHGSRVSNTEMKELWCPQDMQEADFLKLLRLSFPQITGEFDALLADWSKRLTPLRLESLTPETIQQSIKASGKGRSALYLRPKEVEGPQSSRDPPSVMEDHSLEDRRQDGEGPQAGSQDSLEAAGSSGSEQQMETENVDQRGISEDLGALSSGSASEDDYEEAEEGDEEWKPDDEDEPQEKKPKLDFPRSTKKGRVRCSGLKTNMESSRRASGGPVSCKVCKALSGSMNILIRHSWRHLEDPERLCGVCGEQAASAEELKSHLGRHRKTYSCDTCGKNFLTFSFLQSHANLHTGEKPYKCDTCEKAFTSKSHWRNHRWQHVEEKPFRCDVCDQSFAFRQQLKNHQMIHTGQKLYTCDLCHKSVSDIRALSRHKLTHFGEKRYGCQVCGKRFLTPALCKQHAKIHTVRDKTHLCDICCKMFHTPGELKVHLKRHSEAFEKVVCSVCGKELSSKGGLVKHMMIHTDERPYRCSDCGQRFRSTSNLKNHQKTHTGVKLYICQICGKASARKYHLEVHMRTHNGEKPYKCSICGRGFTQSHCLKTHMKSHQTEEEAAVGALMDEPPGAQTL